MTKYRMTRHIFPIKYFYNKVSAASDASGTITVTIVTERAIMLESSALTPSSHGREELTHLGWPLTSKSSIYGRFLARFNFMCANNGRPHRSIIFIRRSTWWMRVCTLPARVYMYAQRRESPRVHGMACIYLLYFLSAAINFRSIFSLLDTPRKNEEKEPRGVYIVSHIAISRILPEKWKRDLLLVNLRNIFKLTLSVIDSK